MPIESENDQHVNLSEAMTFQCFASIDVFVNCFPQTPHSGVAQLGVPAQVQPIDKV